MHSNNTNDTVGKEKMPLLNNLSVTVSEIEFDELIYRWNYNFTKKLNIYCKLRNKLRIIPKKLQK